MRLMDALLNAQTETEFFIHLTRLTRHSAHAGFQTTLEQVNTVNGVALQMSVSQPIKRSEGDSIHLEWTFTHVFTLTALGVLIWKSADETVKGLKDIQNRLNRHQWGSERLTFTS